MILKAILKPIYAFYSRFIGATDFPTTLDIELTNNCNMDCVMCSRSLMKRDVGTMDMALLERIVAEIKLHPPKSVGLHLFGEPLLHPHLIRMVKYVKENVPATSLLMSTNAYLLNQKISEGIVDSGLDRIRFSLDGVRSSTYESLRKGGEFDRVVKNIEEFIKIRNFRNSSHPAIQMQIIGMEDTEKEVGEFKRIWKPMLKKGDRILIQEFVTFGGKVPDRTRFKMASFRDRIKRRLPCLRLWKNLIIYWDGRVSICCYDFDGELLVGDMYKDTIAGIWKGERINSMREAHLSGAKGRFPLCHSCISQK